MAASSAVRRAAERIGDALASPALSGIAFGAVGVALVSAGNPAATGLCASCFLENVAGAVGLHANERMAYLRPEILGIVLGAWLAARAAGERVTGRSGAAGARFVGGALMIVGSAVFLGCPLKLFYRLGAGDGTALAGLAGLVAGVAAASRYLREGFELERTGPGGREAGRLVVAAAAAGVAALALRPAFVVFAERGPGAQHAPWALSLAAGALLGALGQRSRFCTTGALRDALLTRRPLALAGPVAMLVAVAVSAAASGQLHLGFEGQPSSHLAHGWSFLGMALVGFVAVGIGGCPYRQLVLAGQGDAGAATSVLGMLVGAAVVQSWSLGSTVAGPSAGGPVAVLLGIAAALLYAGRRSAPLAVALAGRAA